MRPQRGASPICLSVSRWPLIHLRHSIISGAQVDWAAGPAMFLRMMAPAFFLLAFGFICVVPVCGVPAVCPNTAEALAAIQQQVDVTPAALNWADYFPRLPANLGRRLQVASPCCGIHGSMEALRIMGVGADSVLTYDLDRRYEYYLEKHLRNCGMQGQNIQLALGKVAGDLLRLPLTQLNHRIDLLCAGPPCPPWAGQGKKGSLKDIRSLVFVRLLIWIYILVLMPGPMFLL